MKKITTLLLFILTVVILSLSTTAVYCQDNNNQTNQVPVIICTTSILAHFARAIGQDLIEVEVMVPAGMCPSHFDMKPSHLKAVRQAKILISHDFEPWIDNLLYSANNEEIDHLILSGPWNTPQFAIAKIKKIAALFSQKFPVNQDHFQANAQAFNSEIEQTAIRLKKQAKNLNPEDVQVMTNMHQSSFIQWLGFEEIKAYPSPETISTKQYLEILLTGKQEKADFIVDNLQSGTKFGEKLASDLQIPQVILTNFPGTIPGVNNLNDMLNYNAQQLFDAIKGENK